MPKTGKKKYYWDTCSFIAWIDGGKGHPPEVIAGLEQIAKEVTDNEAILCTSAIIQTEILAGKLTVEQATKIENLFKRKNVLQISVDTKISRRASEIRNHYNMKGIKIKTPDSIHLATAIMYEVDEFNTLDGSGERPRPSDLLPLNGDVAGYPLHIRVPTGQPGLFTAIGLAVVKAGNEQKDKDLK